MECQRSSHGDHGCTAVTRVATSLRASSKADLEGILAQLSADEDGIRHTSWGTVDCLSTYTRNTKDPPAAPILPGFAPEGIALNPRKALAAFMQFCRSQHGQRKHFVLIIHENPPLAPKVGRVFADLDALMGEWKALKVSCRPAMCNGCPSKARGGTGAKEMAQ